MNATLPTTDHAYNATNYGGKKETTDRYVLVAFDDVSETFADVVDARFYMSRSRTASVVYCSVWVRTEDGRTFSGSGKAGGYGYCRSSAAFDEALTAAGVKLSCDVHGRGMGAVREAMQAVADAAGYADAPQHVIS